jgi:predicted transposase YbfD/YdcC
VVRVQRQRHFVDRVEGETAYYISSLPHVATRLLHAIRSHWAIENQFHWVLYSASVEAVSQHND